MATYKREQASLTRIKELVTRNEELEARNKELEEELDKAACQEVGQGAI